MTAPDLSGYVLVHESRLQALTRLAEQAQAAVQVHAGLRYDQLNLRVQAISSVPTDTPALADVTTEWTLFKPDGTQAEIPCPAGPRGGRPNLGDGLPPAYRRTLTYAHRTVIRGPWIREEEQ